MLNQDNQTVEQGKIKMLTMQSKSFSSGDLGVFFFGEWRTDRTGHLLLMRRAGAAAVARARTRSRSGSSRGTRQRSRRDGGSASSWVTRRRRRHGSGSAARGPRTPRQPRMAARRDHGRRRRPGRTEVACGLGNDGGAAMAVQRVGRKRTETEPCRPGVAALAGESEREQKRGEVGFWMGDPMATVICTNLNTMEDEGIKIFRKMDRNPDVHHLEQLKV